MASRTSPRVALDRLSVSGAVVPRTRLRVSDWPRVGASGPQQSTAACQGSAPLAKTTHWSGSRGVFHGADQLGTWDWGVLCMESSRRSHTAGGDRYVVRDSRHMQIFNSN